MNSIPLPRRTGAPRPLPGAVHAVAAWAVAALLASSAAAEPAGPTPADAAPPASPLGAELEQQVKRLALDGSAQPLRPGARVEVLVGALDARLKLAPCQRIEPYLPVNARLWGRTRIGLKCTLGATPWNVYLPLTVKVWARGLAAARPLAPGLALTASDLVEAEVDLADEPGAVLAGPADAAAAVGRTLARPLSPGQGVRATDFKPRVWFAAGDGVTIRATGAGYAVEGGGQALGPGVEGQPVRVRTDAGRVVTGLPAPERRVDVTL